MCLHFETAAQKNVSWYTHTRTAVEQSWTSVEEEGGCFQQYSLDILISSHWMHPSVSVGCTHQYPFGVPQLSPTDGATCLAEHPVREKRRNQQFQGCPQSAATLGGHMKSWNKRRQRQKQRQRPGEGRGHKKEQENVAAVAPKQEQSSSGSRGSNNKKDTRAINEFYVFRYTHDNRRRRRRR